MNSAGVVIQDTTQTQARVFPELGNWSMFLPLALLVILVLYLPSLLIMYILFDTNAPDITLTVKPPQNTKYIMKGGIAQFFFKSKYAFLINFRKTHTQDLAERAFCVVKY